MDLIVAEPFAESILAAVMSTAPTVERMAAPTNLAEASNKSLANGEPSTHGTEPNYRECRLKQGTPDVRESQGITWFGPERTHNNDWRPD